MKTSMIHALSTEKKNHSSFKMYSKTLNRILNTDIYFCFRCPIDRLKALVILNAHNQRLILNFGKDQCLHDTYISFHSIEI